MAPSISISNPLTTSVPGDASKWVGEISWSSAAGSDIRQASKSLDLESLASLLRDATRRKTRRKSSSSANGNGHLLRPGSAPNPLSVLWSPPRGTQTARSERLMTWAKNGKAKSIERQLKSWLQESNARSPISAHELLILLELLTDHGPRLSSELYLQIWITCLAGTARIAAQLQDQRTLQLEADELALIAGELPWRAGLFFRNVTGAKTLMQRGRNELRRQLLEFTDTDGTPCAALVARLPHWSACLLRSTQSAATYRERLWNHESSDRFRYLIAVMATLATADGNLAFCARDPHTLDVLQQGIRLAGLEKKSDSSRLVRRLKRHRKDPARGRKQIRSPRIPAVQSDWARLAILRSQWAIDADQVAITHHETHPKLHLACLGHSIISGDWKLQIRLQGRTLHGDQDWSCVCWNSDGDVDYMELQATYGDAVRVDRQIMLSRKQHFLILADSVQGPTGQRLKYTSRLPLVPDTECSSDTDTRECQLRTAGARVRVFPLGLPQDRLYSADGELTANGEVLELSHTGQHGLYAPLVLNWNPDQRMARPTWRPLTTTQSRQILGPADSAAYRIQLDSQQWLLYRRIQASQQLQTVLGLHTGHETVIAEISRRGQIKPLLQVES